MQHVQHDVAAVARLQPEIADHQCRLCLPDQRIGVRAALPEDGSVARNGHGSMEPLEDDEVVIDHDDQGARVRTIGGNRLAIQGWR